MSSWNVPTKKPGRVRKAVSAVRRARKKLSLATVLWGVVSTVLLIVALVLQGLLWFLASVLFAGFAVVSAFADFAGPDGIAGAVPVQPAKGRRGASSRKSGQIAPPCTKTGTPIDRCRCAPRHVATQDGADRYKKRVGDPLGKGATKAPAVGGTA